MMVHLGATDFVYASFLWVVCLMDLFEWESLIFVSFHVFCHTTIIMSYMWTHLDFFL